MKAANAINIADLQAIARRRLPPVIFDTLEGGAGDEVSLRANRSAFEQIQFRPSVLHDVSRRDLSVSVFDEVISMPLMLAPTGAGRVAHPDAELAVARAAGEAGTVYMQSTVTSYPLAEIARVSRGPLWYQLYLPREASETERMLSEVAAAGYRALAITVDAPVFGSRERDRRNRVMGSKARPKFIAQGALHPGWSAGFLRGNLDRRASEAGARRLSIKDIQSTILASSFSVTWDDVKRVRELWTGPLLLKGIMRADECEEMIRLGVDGIVVSNHGGRQLDGVPATIEVLPSVVAACAGRAEVFVDGGVRRGGDVVKALALGAKAVFIGRPYLYGLAAGGSDGVARALQIFREEIDTTMALLGCASIAEIDASRVTLPASWPAVGGRSNAAGFADGGSSFPVASAGTAD